VEQLVASSRMHAPAPPHDAAPHAVFSVTRAHASVSVRVIDAHVPAAQRGTTTSRACVPDSSQTSAKPAHALQTPAISAPHDEPSVIRAQPAASTSIVVLGVHVPPAHA
jgi:hypothetical protein